MMRARLHGEPYDEHAYAPRVRSAVGDIVRQQAEHGIDVVNDGEQSKSGFAVYVRERLSGFEPDPTAPPGRGLQWKQELATFPEYYDQYFGKAMRSIAPATPLMCTGPIAYQGEAALRADIENLRAATSGLQPSDIFMPSSAPRRLGRNTHYKTNEEYVYAIAEAMRTEYQAIAAAGFLLQIDDPALTDFYSEDPALGLAARHQAAEVQIEALNHALRGIPAEQIRYHTCYGINEGPRVFDTPLADIVDLMLKVNAGAYSFEAANPRHEHEWHVWEQVQLPEGKIL